MGCRAAAHPVHPALGPTGGGDTTQAGAPGGEGGASVQGPAATPGTGEGGNRSEQIGRRLDETFGTFDAAVRTAQADIAKERAAADGAGSGAGGGSGDEEASGEDGESGDGGDAGSGPAREGGLESTGAGGEGGADGSGGESGSGNAEDGAQSSSQQGGVGGGGAKGGKGPMSVPADIPDGKDDDIVARQIREAAMKETDPELREALWEEYRRYKKGS